MIYNGIIHQWIMISLKYSESKFEEVEKLEQKKNKRQHNDNAEKHLSTK